MSYQETSELSQKILDSILTKRKGNYKPILEQVEYNGLQQINSMMYPNSDKPVKDAAVMLMFHLMIKTRELQRVNNPSYQLVETYLNALLQDTEYFNQEQKSNHPLSVDSRLKSIYEQNQFKAHSKQVGNTLAIVRDSIFTMYTHLTNTPIMDAISEIDFSLNQSRRYKDLGIKLATAFLEEGLDLYSLGINESQHYPALARETIELVVEISQTHKGTAITAEELSGTNYIKGSLSYKIHELEKAITEPRFIIGPKFQIL